MANYIMIGNKEKFFVNFHYPDFNRKSLDKNNELIMNKLPYFQIENIIDDDNDIPHMFVLPKNCRFIYKHPYLNTLLFVIEEEPQYRTINFKKEINTEYRKLNKNPLFENFDWTDKIENMRFNGSLRLFFPYSIFYFIISYNKHYDKYIQHIRTYYGFRKSPLNTLNDIIYHSTLPNIGTNLMVCTGYKKDFEVEDIDINVIEKLIANFWTSTFNNDLEDSYLEMAKRKDSKTDIFSWDYYSKNDPVFILKENYIPYGSLSSLIQNSMFNLTRNLSHQDSYNINSFLNNKLPCEILIRDIENPNNMIVKRENDIIEVDNKKYIIKKAINDCKLLITDEDGNDKEADYNFIMNIEEVDKITIKNGDENIEIKANGFIIHKKLKNIIKKIHKIKINKTDNLITIETNDKNSYIIVDSFLEEWEITNYIKTSNDIELKIGKQIYLIGIIDDNIYLYYKDAYEITNIDFKDNDIYLFLKNIVNNEDKCLYMNNENKSFCFTEKLNINGEMFKNKFMLIGNHICGNLYNKMYYDYSKDKIYLTPDDENYNMDKIKDCLFNEDFTKLTIPSNNGNYELSVNDDILYMINNEIPGKQTIKNFDINLDQMIIYVNIEQEMEDEDKRSFPISLFNLENTKVPFDIRLRKITYNHEKYPKGTRITLKSDKRSLELPFSKYNCYEIHCVITDCILQMALLTNGQTVYLMDIPEYFDVLYPDDKKYNKKVIKKPNLNFQFGDYVNTNASNLQSMKVVCFVTGYNCYYSSSLDGKHLYGPYYDNLKKYFRYATLPNPRFMTNDLVEVTNVLPDFRNIFVNNPNKLLFYQERRIMECLKS